MHQLFRKFSTRTSVIVGSSWSFIIALVIILSWLISGPIFQFSNTWQLVINTGTTIVTFLMVFLIQNTQNRDSKAIHLKLDELLYASKKAKDKYMDAEDMSDEDLEKDKQVFIKISKQKE